MSFITSPTTTVSFARQTRTSNTQLTSGNIGQLIYITSGTFTQTFDACASLGSGWYCYIENAGTGNITLDPFGSETIDGLTSFIMYPGETRLIQCDGINLISIVLTSFYVTFTASDTFTKPPGYTSFSGYLWGGGGSGARSNSAVKPTSGGGGGACNPFTLAASLFGASETITIGSGGAGITIAANGNVGGTSSIGSIVFAYGGGGGTFDSSPSNSTCTAGAGGGVMSAGATGNIGTTPAVPGLPAMPTQAGSQYSANGFGGMNGQTGAGAYGGGSGGDGTTSLNTSVTGKRAWWGGGGGAGLGIGVGCPFAAGGTSINGGSGGAVNGSGSDGGNGTAPAGGGGATHTGTTSGAGARGELRIWGIV